MKTKNTFQPAPSADALKTLADMVRRLEMEKAECESNLSALILNGSPYLLVMREKDGNERVWGSWKQPNGETVKGWQSLAIVPFHLCGCSLFTPESARANLAKLTGTEGEGVTFSMRHEREEWQRRIDYANELLPTLCAKLAEFAPA